MSMNNLGIVKRNIVRADKAAVDKLSRFGVATIHEAMGRVGLTCAQFIRGPTWQALPSRCCCIQATTG